jgi:transcriptional regulator with XRE-family HTH domain
MATLTNEQKKELAKELFLQGNFTFAEIAEKVGSARQTISKWATQGKWDELKTYMTVGKEKVLKGFYQQLANIQEAIMSREPGERIASSTEADRQIKLASAIRKLEDECGITGLIDAGIRFCNYMRTVDIDEAKKIAKYWDLFLTNEMK